MTCLSWVRKSVFCWFSCYARQDTGIMTRLSWAGKSFFLLIFRGKIFFVLPSKPDRIRKSFFVDFPSKPYRIRETWPVCLERENLFVVVYFASKPDRIQEKWPVCHERENILLLLIFLLCTTGYGKHDMFVMSGKILIGLDFPSMPNRIWETWPVCHEREDLYCVRFFFYAR